ncbi:centromere kinetochore component CENP-T-domain-containing protein [Chaetomium strumarium]|uniref:Centromere kinetochore component CENP-T-domain-containing protein n=1 Tax=Chaetomium strumarium TaxID=1170767 RepID=A0AAJ0M6C8_9PEZI|nr:centromere kinetochore component CENP-T-domain-containing protein [Chaetomium strumarium]
MARENQHPDATPSRRASSAEPFASSNRRSVFRTPASQGRGLPRPQGLSASGRKVAPPAATPHARAAFRTIDSRRAAIFTPHRARRKSLREVRDSPRDFLLSLGRVLARNTEVITTSSSSSPGEADRTVASDGPGNDTTLGSINVDEDDEDDEELPKRPRLSLPIDEEDEDDSDDLQPHRSVLIDDDNNFTMQSIEMPRRAYSEQPMNRFSMGSVRMSDYFDTHDMLHSEDVGIDSGFFPPTAALDETNIAMGLEELPSPERLDSDANRPDPGRESDFRIDIPVGDVNESTFLMAPQVVDSPDGPPGRLPVATAEVVHDDYAPLLDQRSDDYDDEDLFGGVPALEDEPLEAQNEQLHDETEREPMTARGPQDRRLTKKTIKVSKYGIEYPSLPPAVVKRLAQNFARANGAKGKITPDAMKAIMQASDWFFEQLGEDLQAYAKHAGRKTIDESDVLTLMKRQVTIYQWVSRYCYTWLTLSRQRQINPNTTPFALAQRHLPRELLQELRMPPPVVPKKRRKTNGGTEDEDVT